MTDLLKKELHKRALLVTNPVNQRYLLKRQVFDASGAVYVSCKRMVYLSWMGKMPIESTEEYIVKEIDKSELSDIVKKLIEDDRADGEIKELLLEEDAPSQFYVSLNGHLSNIGIKIRLQSGLIEASREIKSEWELEQLKIACEITDCAFLAVLGKIHAGVTELEIAAELEREMRLRGAEESNRTIVAAGVNSASPHHWAADYCIKEGDFVTMDYGCTYQGYHSDMTRTVIVGKATDKQRHIYQTVLEAQLAAEAALKAGLTGGELDAVARKIIDEAGYSEAFVHNLGHGIGLSIHEGTGLVRDSGKILKPGMVVSVEPGIYLEGYGGVRIEDIAVVREDGCEILEYSGKTLYELNE